jgi:hypothetical protein
MEGRICRPNNFVEHFHGFRKDCDLLRGINSLFI